MSIDWSQVVTVLGSGGITLGGLLAGGKRFLKAEVQTIAVEANKPLTDGLAAVQHDLNNVKLSLATQFGGNGGGMRQAINELRVSVARLEERSEQPRPLPYR